MIMTDPLITTVCYYLNILSYAEFTAFEQIKIMTFAL